jgi:HEAT repeat protein
MAAVLAAMAGGTAPCAVLAQTRPATNPTTVPTINVETLVRSQLEQLRVILNEPQTAPDARADAANRLAARKSSDARNILRDTLLGAAVGPQIAVANALADHRVADPNLITPLYAALTNERSEELNRAAARALACYKDNPEALRQLMGAVRQRPAFPRPIRTEAIRAIGTFQDKSAAQFLISVLTDAAPEQEPVRNAVAEALINMTGATQFGTDPARWAAWWATQRNKSDAEFRSDLAPLQSANLDQARQQLDDLTQRMRVLLERAYRAAPTAQKPEVLMGYLTDPNPEIRLLGTLLVEYDAREAKPITRDVKERLRNMIGDGNAEVRKNVAQDLALLNDAEALEPLLAQLDQESDSDVRAALTAALGPINSLAAVPSLLKLLHDPDPSVQRQAIQALTDAGPKIRDNRELARLTGMELKKLYDALPLPPAPSDMRVRLIGAMVPLGLEELLTDTFYPILNERRDETAEMRRLAVKAIGIINKPGSEVVVRDRLNDPANSVRWAATNVIGNMPNAAKQYAQQLCDMATSDPDPSVREEAWKAVQSALPELAPQQLQAFADRFNSPDGKPRRILILQELKRQLLKAQRIEELASTDQSLADALKDIGDYSAAAQEYAQALEYHKTRNDSPAIISTLLVRRLEALLKAKQYGDAVAFVSESSKEQASSLTLLAPQLKNYAEVLKNEGKLDDALLLIQEAYKMDPPLPEIYTRQLKSLETEINATRNARGTSGPGANNSVVPRSANTSRTLDASATIR